MSIFVHHAGAGQLAFVIVTSALFVSSVIVWLTSDPRSRSASDPKRDRKK